MSKKNVAKKRKTEPERSSKIDIRTVNKIVRYLAAEAAVNANTNIAKEWLLWDIACLVADKFGTSWQIRALLKNPARSYAERSVPAPLA